MEYLIPKEVKNVKEDFFYNKVIKQLEVDMLFMSCNHGIKIDIKKLNELQESLKNISNETEYNFYNNSLIKAYTHSKFKGEQSKTLQDFLVKFDIDQESHRTFVMNEYLSRQQKYHKYKMNIWSKKDIQFLYNEISIKTSFIEAMATENLDSIKQELDEYMYKFSTKKFELYNRARLGLDVKINLASNDQKKEILQFLGLKTDNVKRETLEELYELYSSEDELTSPEVKDLCEILGAFLTVSHVNTISKSYIENIKNSIDSNNTIFPQYSLFGTKTFRLGCRNPNMLCLPNYRNKYSKDLQRCFIARDGRIFLKVDYSSLEDRILANLSRDENKILIYENGIDSHLYNAIAYFKPIFDEISHCSDGDSLVYYNHIKELSKTKDIILQLRDKSKPCTFTMNYLGGWKSIHEKMNIPEEQAKDIYNSYKKLYSGLERYKGEVLDEANKNQYIELGLGLKMYTDSPKKDIRTLYNAKAQFWSILTLIVIHNIHAEAIERGFDNALRIIGCVHDSIIFEIPNEKEWIEYACNLIDSIVGLTYISEDHPVLYETKKYLGLNLGDMELIDEKNF